MYPNMPMTEIWELLRCNMGMSRLFQKPSNWIYGAPRSIYSGYKVFSPGRASAPGVDAASFSMEPAMPNDVSRRLKRCDRATLKLFYMPLQLPGLKTMIIRGRSWVI